MLLVQTPSSPPSLSSDPHGSWTAFSLDLRVGIWSQLCRAQHNPDVYETQRCPKSRLGLSHDNPSLTCCFLIACSLGLPPRCVHTLPSAAESFLHAGCTSKVPRAPLSRLRLSYDSTCHTLLTLYHAHVCVFIHLLMEYGTPSCQRQWEHLTVTSDEWLQGSAGERNGWWC